MNVCDNLGDHLVGNVYVKVPVVPCLEHRSGNISVRMATTEPSQPEDY